MSKKHRTVPRGMILSENVAAMALIGMLIAIIGPWTTSAMQLQRIAERSRFAAQTTANLASVIGEMPLEKLSEESLNALAEREEQRLAGDEASPWEIAISLSETREEAANIGVKRISIRMTHETGSPAPHEIVIWRHAALSLEEQKP